MVDVGNTRIKWGRCDGARVVEVVALPADAPQTWQLQLERWPGASDARWIISGVHPQRRDTLAAWLRERAPSVQVLDSYRQLPLVVQVDAPEKVGIDRLLNAVAANTRRCKHVAAIIVDAGSAVTVDYVDPSGAFRGGAIFPGLRLMAQALREHTAMLPFVQIDRAESPPGTSTAQAIRVGVFHAVVGGARELIARYGAQARSDAGYAVYLTGGDGPLLNTAHDPLGAGAGMRLPDGIGDLWPEMTLEGMLHSVLGATSHG
jgi:type III pantothenate kinase